MRALILSVLLLIQTLSYGRTLVIGTSFYNPPFEVSLGAKQGSFGFDIDLMTEICKRLNAQCLFRSEKFSGLFNLLQTNQVDLLIASIIVTPSRENQFLFSQSYMQSYAQFIANHSTAINCQEDMVGKRIGVRTQTPYGNLAVNNIPKAEIIEYPTVGDILTALQNNQIDMALIDYQTARYWIASNPGIYKLIQPKIPIGFGYAIVANPNQQNLIGEINQVLDQMNQDGTYAYIYSQYFNW